MGTSVIFDLVTELVSTIDTATASDVIVTDGYGVTDDPAHKFVMVGIEDPDSDDGRTAEAQQSWAGLGAESRDEVGTVTCVACAWNGESEGLATARADVKTILAAIENDLRTDPNLGATVTGLQWVGFGTRMQMTQIQAEDGSSVLCVFDIAFRARI